MFENRDISVVTMGGKPVVRPGKACGHNTGMHAAEKSDIGITGKTTCHLDKLTVKGRWIKIAGDKVAVHQTPVQTRHRKSSKAR